MEQILTYTFIALISWIICGSIAAYLAGVHDKIEKVEMKNYIPLYILLVFGPFALILVLTLIAEVTFVRYLYNKGNKRV